MTDGTTEQSSFEANRGAIERDQINSQEQLKAFARFLSVNANRLKREDVGCAFLWKEIADSRRPNLPLAIMTIVPPQGKNGGDDIHVQMQLVEPAIHSKPETKTILDMGIAQNGELVEVFFARTSGEGKNLIRNNTGFRSNDTSVQVDLESAGLEAFARGSGAEISLAYDRDSGWTTYTISDEALSPSVLRMIDRAQSMLNRTKGVRTKSKNRLRTLPLVDNEAPGLHFWKYNRGDDLSNFL